MRRKKCSPLPVLILVFTLICVKNLIVVKLKGESVDTLTVAVLALVDIVFMFLTTAALHRGAVID